MARIAAILLSLLGTWAAGSSASPVWAQGVAEHPSPPASAAEESLPSGYRIERDGPVRWTYPKAAKSEVQPLQALQRRLWPQFGTELGAYLEPELDIRVAVNPEQMQALAHGRRLPAYASGVAFPGEGMILLTLTAPESWLRPDMERLLAHELSHVALHRALRGNPVPRWFAEGLAIQHSGEHSLARVRSLWAATLQGDLVALRDLSASFPSRHGEVDLAYAESADLVGFMLEGESGPPRFRTLCRELQAGKSFESAFAAAYQMSLLEFEHQWRAQLAQRFGRWPSILSGLTLVWVLAALLLVLGYVRVRRRHRRTLARWAIEEAPMASLEQQPQAAQPVPLARSVADAVLDAWGDQQRHDSGIPTIVHEGRSYTLH